MSRHTVELERAAHNRLDAHLADLQHRRQENTTDWVDPAYSARLANQLHAAIRNQGELRASLRAMRESVAYVTEYKLPDGSFSVWALDTSLFHATHLLLSGYRYDALGRLDRKSLWGNSQGCIYITRHAAQRLYQRLRTNSRDDFKGVIQILTTLPCVDVVDLGRLKALEFPGFGRFELVVDRLKEAQQQVDAWAFAGCPAIHVPATWVVKTFIDVRS